MQTSPPNAPPHVQVPPFMLNCAPAMPDPRWPFQIMPPPPTAISQHPNDGELEIDIDKDSDFGQHSQYQPDHAGSFPFQCYCGHEFQAQKLYRLHILEDQCVRWRDIKIRGNIIICTCGVQFAQRGSLFRHLRTRQCRAYWPDGGRALICLCGAKFNRRDNMVRHQKSPRCRQNCARLGVTGNPQDSIPPIRKNKHKKYRPSDALYFEKMAFTMAESTDDEAVVNRRWYEQFGGRNEPRSRNNTLLKEYAVKPLSEVTAAEMNAAETDSQRYAYPVAGQHQEGSSSSAGHVGSKDQGNTATPHGSTSSADGSSSAEGTSVSSASSKPGSPVAKTEESPELSNQPPSGSHPGTPKVLHSSASGAKSPHISSASEEHAPTPPNGTPVKSESIPVIGASQGAMPAATSQPQASPQPVKRKLSHNGNFQFKQGPALFHNGEYKKPSISPRIKDSQKESRPAVESSQLGQPESTAQSQQPQHQPQSLQSQEQAKASPQQQQQPQQPQTATQQSQPSTPHKPQESPANGAVNGAVNGSVSRGSTPSQTPQAQVQAPQQVPQGFTAPQAQAQTPQTHTHTPQPQESLNGQSNGQHNNGQNSQNGHLPFQQHQQQYPKPHIPPFQQQPVQFQQLRQPQQPQQPQFPPQPQARNFAPSQPVFQTNANNKIQSAPGFYGVPQQQSQGQFKPLGAPAPQMVPMSQAMPPQQPVSRPPQSYPPQSTPQSAAQPVLASPKPAASPKVTPAPVQPITQAEPPSEEEERKKKVLGGIEAALETLRARLQTALSPYLDPQTSTDVGLSLTQAIWSIITGFMTDDKVPLSRAKVLCDTISVGISQVMLARLLDTSNEAFVRIVHEVDRATFEELNVILKELVHD